MYVGRALGFPIAMEGALKLKELSYVHAEGYAAGELKHGPIALLDRDTPLVAIATRGATYEKVVSNVAEVRAREAPVVAVATEGDEKIDRYAAGRPLRPRDARGAVAGHRRSCRSSCWPTRSRSRAAPMSTSRATWRSRSRSNSRRDSPDEPPRDRVDLIDIDRIIASLARFPDRFRERVLTEGEARYCGGKAERIAGRWAAKEAISKVLGLGVRGVGWREIEILPNWAGAPQVRLHARAAARAAALGLEDVTVSISHERQDGHGRRDRPRPGIGVGGGRYRADLSLGGDAPAASSRALAQGDIRAGAGRRRLHGVRGRGAARRARGAARAGAGTGVPGHARIGRERACSAPHPS